MKQKLFALGTALLLCVSLCVPVLAAPAENTGPLPVTPDFSFSSGVGAWATTLTIHTDGTFEGNYFDSDMGDIGEGYPGGTEYISIFCGKFDHIIQKDPYTWSMKLASLDMEDTPGSEWIEDGVKYIASEPAGMPDIGGEVLLYLPGHDRASLSESFLSWTMYAGSGSADTAEIDFFGLFNVKDECGFVSSLEDSQAAQTAQAVQELISAGNLQGLMELVAYYGDISACKMSADQARAFAQVIEDQTAQLYQLRDENSSWYGYIDIATYAALFDLGNGVPALFFAGGGLPYYYYEKREDGCYWSDVGEIGIWLYENGKAVEYEPPHSGMTLALFPSALFVGGYQGSEGTFYDGRVYPIRDGAIASEPELIAEVDYDDSYEHRTCFLNGSQVSEAEFEAVVEKWDENLSLTGHSYGGGAEGNIWGMCQAEKMRTVLDAYAEVVNMADTSVPSRPSADTDVPERPDEPDVSAPDDSEPDASVPEKDREADREFPVMTVIVIAAIVIAVVVIVAAVIVAVLIRKKKAADTVQTEFISPGAGRMPDAGQLSVQPRTPEPLRTAQGTQSPEPGWKVNFCPHCGSKVWPGGRFCTECGKPLN